MIFAGFGTTLTLLHKGALCEYPVELDERCFLPLGYVPERVSRTEPIFRQNMFSCVTPRTSVDKSNKCFDGGKTISGERAKVVG